MPYQAYQAYQARPREITSAARERSVNDVIVGAKGLQWHHGVRLSLGARQRQPWPALKADTVRVPDPEMVDGTDGEVDGVVCFLMSNVQSARGV
jgi:hypothetical protein